jgi:tellurite resistance protein
LSIETSHKEKAMEFFPEIEINENQANAIAQGLYAIARADGSIHPREASLINDFLSPERPSDFGALERAPDISPEHLAMSLQGDEIRKLFIKTALLLSYVDGAKAAGEEKLIHAYAKAFGMSDKDVHMAEEGVKDYLIGNLSHLKNTQAVANIAKELKY